MPRLLLVTYEFPPKGGPGIQRPLQTARLLSASGWDVTVLTVLDPPTSLLDERALAQVPPEVRVARAWSLEPTRLVQWLKRRRAGGVVTPQPAQAQGYSGVPRQGVRIIQSAFFPDEKVGWIPYAQRVAIRLHAVEPFDVILASGPPFTAFSLADRLSRRLGIPWVADIRDPIVDNFVMRPLTRFHASYLRRFERRVVERAARTLVVSDWMRRQTAERVPDAADKLVTLTNGFDPTLFPGPCAAGDSSAFTITHTGTFQGPVNPATFLRAVRIAREGDAQLARDLRIRFVGAPDPRTQSLVAETGNEDIVTVTGFVSHDEAVREMRDSDVLLLVLAEDPSLRPALTGKLPEYLGARKPLLALVADGAARDVVARAGAAQIAAPEDTVAAAEALARLYAMWRESALPVPDEDVVREFDRVRLVERLSGILGDVIGHPAAGD